MLKSRTLVATPAYRGDVVMQYAHSIVRDAVLAIGQGHFVDAPYFINDTYIHAARNRAVQTMLTLGNWDFLMFIDADMGWSAGALGDLLSLPRDLDVVGGVYRKKEDVPSYPFSPLEGTPIKFPLGEIAGVATGFMRITRGCLERTIATHPDGRLFNHFVDAHDVEWGDDMAFCHRVRAAGGRVWGKFDIEFEHVGPHAWKGTCMQDMASSQGYVLPPGSGVKAA